MKIVENVSVDVDIQITYQFSQLPVSAEALRAAADKAALAASNAANSGPTASSTHAEDPTLHPSHAVFGRSMSELHQAVTHRREQLEAALLDPSLTTDEKHALIIEQKLLTPSISS